MDEILLLQGAVGVTNAAAIGTETGDCSACPATWTHYLYLDDVNQFIHLALMYDGTCSGNTSNVGFYDTANNRWGQTKAASLPVPNVGMHCQVTLSAHTTITSAYAYGYYGSGTRYAHMTVNNVHQTCGSGIGIPADHYGSALSLTGGTFDIAIELSNDSATANGYCNYWVLTGTGVDPFNL